MQGQDKAAPSLLMRRNAEQVDRQVDREKVYEQPLGTPADRTAPAPSEKGSFARPPNKRSILLLRGCLCNGEVSVP